MGQILLGRREWIVENHKTTHNFSDTQEEKTPTTWQKIGRIATLAFFAAMFWAGMWIFG